MDIIARYYNTVPDGVINGKQKQRVYIPSSLLIVLLDRFRIESGYETQEYTVLTDAQQVRKETKERRRGSNHLFSLCRSFLLLFLLLSASGRPAEVWGRRLRSID